MDCQRKDNSLFWGLLMVIAGGLLLLSNLDFWPDIINRYVLRWESFVIVIGLLLIIARKKIIGGMALLGVGGYFLLEDLYFFQGNWEIWFWPALFLITGVGLIVTHKYGKGQ